MREIHTVSKSAIDQVDLALLLLFVPHQIGAALFAALTVDEFGRDIRVTFFVLGIKYSQQCSQRVMRCFYMLVEVQYEFQQEKTIGRGSAEGQRHLIQRDMVSGAVSRPVLYQDLEPSAASQTERMGKRPPLRRRPFQRYFGVVFVPAPASPACAQDRLPTSAEQEEDAVPSSSCIRKTPRSRSRDRGRGEVEWIALRKHGRAASSGFPDRGLPTLPQGCPGFSGLE